MLSMEQARELRDEARNYWMDNSPRGLFRRLARDRQSIAALRADAARGDMAVAHRAELEAKIANQKVLIAQFEDKHAKQKRELTELRLVLERKNRELDAMHFVWCDGGCDTGAHRYDADPEAVTAEVVGEAVRNTDRLVRWYVNHHWRKGTDVRSKLAVLPWVPLARLLRTFNLYRGREDALNWFGSKAGCTCIFGRKPGETTTTWGACPVHKEAVDEDTHTLR